jgi:hypothetical protein
MVFYDGSDSAHTALKIARIAFDHAMVVACYWQPFAESDKPLGIDLLEVVQDPQSINDREQALAAHSHAELRIAMLGRPAPTATRVSRVTAQTSRVRRL